VAAFIAEPIMGAGGVIPAPEGYLQKMYELIRKYDGLCISDEVQSGFGRTGKETWGFKWQNVKPDIIVTAKGIANGYPMAAVVTRKEIMDSINFIFFNTYGGGPLQCRLAS
jgi:4-aminobutyrate aminotransferase-like enzyme